MSFLPRALAAAFAPLSASPSPQGERKRDGAVCAFPLLREGDERGRSRLRSDAP